MSAIRITVCVVDLHLLCCQDDKLTMSFWLSTYELLSISLDRLDGLALLAIKNECAKQLNVDDLIDTFDKQ